MQIYNTETGEVDTVNNQQALRVIARTNGLWVQYVEPTPEPETKEQLPPTKKRVVKKKSTIKRK